MKSLEARLKAIKASDDQAVLLQALDDRSHLIIEAAARRPPGGAHRASGTHQLRPRRRRPAGGQARPAAGELNEVLGECMDALVVLPAARAAVVYALASIRADGTLTALRRLADDAVRHAARSFLSPE